jgi:hypothetical protein
MAAQRRQLATQLAEADAAVLHATRDLLEYIERDAPLVPVLRPCFACRLPIPDGEEREMFRAEIPGSAFFHPRCVPGLQVSRLNTGTTGDPEDAA